LKLDNESFARICDIFKVVKPTSEKINQDYILRALRFKDIEARYERIDPAAPKTFEWCLFDSRIPESCRDLKISFRDWLAKGSGVFHFSGKPGSGKSTLMRFIVDHMETKAQLQGWANNKTLILVSFFFWKPEGGLQSSREGLLRSLLYGILSQIPEAIPTVFPQYWNPGKMDPRPAEIDLKIPLDILVSTFEEIVRSSDSLPDHCFCFFIDGLDELANLAEHQPLAKCLQRWTYSDKKRIKICVSSREENAFMDVFPKQRRLRLHQVTENDIRKMTTTVLENHDQFMRDTIKDKDRKELIQAIVDKAEGVFLWVKLVLEEMAVALNDLVDGQSLGALHKRLKAVPKELEKYIENTIESIHDPYNGNVAWTVLALIRATESFSAQSRLSIMHYCFIQRYCENENHRLSAEQSLKETDIKLEVEAFLKGVNTLCRGLIDPVIREPKTTPSELEYWVFKDSLSFTHRSIYEYLTIRPPEKIKTFFNSLDVQSLILECLIA
jgi:hypothetical protein